ncbi:unnamed protein product [Orchesella dallaii]|uniref:tRNA wybutosine-synthesizing protein 4 n=1 Tax=Orchesella dallaii TaxID=48710 RepID=A0ABP1QDV5_9HEXA
MLPKKGRTASTSIGHNGPEDGRRRSTASTSRMAGGLAEAKQVRETGDWSSDSKLSAIHNGYWEDPFFRFFNPTDPSKIRRTSLICRGYYVRFRVCDYFLRRLIKDIGEPIQVVSLGCGMDSCYFRILPELENMICKFFEMDFKTVIKAKKSVIAHTPILRVMAEERLKLLACDLRFVVTLHETLKNNGFEFDKPTVFYSECVVNYLGPNETTNILEWITANVPNSIWLAYEQCNALDGFGQIMLSHFVKNGCPLLSLISAHSREDQEAQLRRAGFKVSQVINAWDAFIKIGTDDPPHFPRLKNAEHQFDEYEQLIATSLHYSVRVGLNGDLARKSKITELLDKFHLHLVPSSRQPGIAYETVKNSHALKLDILQGTYLPTLSGHETIVINSNTLLTLGGSGESSVRMKHLIRSQISFMEDDGNPQELSLSDPFEDYSATATAAEVHIVGSSGPLTVKSKILLENADHYERIHSCAVFIPGSAKSKESHDSVLIFGGRKSPKVPCSNDLIELNVNKIDSKVNIASVIMSSKFDGSCPKPRWRHAMSACLKEGAPHVLLFGGRNPDMVLGDCWWFQVDEFNWSEVPSSSGVGSWPTPRHSHAMASDMNGSTVYMIGGVSEDDTTLCEHSFWIYQAETDKWANIDEWNSFARRVGHSVVKNRNWLVIVGGYGADSSYGFDFLAAICDLECNTVKIVTQTLPLNDIYLPFGFTASVLHDEKTKKHKIIVFGGGGNCFSFGTHYNQVCYLLTINE